MSHPSSLDALSPEHLARRMGELRGDMIGSAVLAGHLPREEAAFDEQRERAALAVIAFGDEKRLDHLVLLCRTSYEEALAAHLDE